MNHKIVISIIDDDESVRQAVTNLMKSLGYEASAFERADDFLNSGSRSNTSCLIADMQMPGMTGLALHRRLAASGEPIPTILITAYPDEKVRTRALRDGVICYLSKPFKEEDLLACIGAALGKSTTRGTTRQ